MSTEISIRAILKHLEDKRYGRYLFNDNETATDIVKYFKKKGYKAYIVNSFNTVIISKRWWQR